MSRENPIDKPNSPTTRGLKVPCSATELPARNRSKFTSKTRQTQEHRQSLFRRYQCPRHTRRIRPRAKTTNNGLSNTSIDIPDRLWQGLTVRAAGEGIAFARVHREELRSSRDARKPTIVRVIGVLAKELAGTLAASIPWTPGSRLRYGRQERRPGMEGRSTDTLITSAIEEQRN